MTYDQVIENLEWLEDKGRKLSRYTDDQGSSIWVDHDTCEIVEDFSLKAYTMLILASITA